MSQMQRDRPRPYRMRVRAEERERMRLRITEATVELHGTVGPARTTVSAIAERAGVPRSTVYRHFPDDAALFDACRAHWLAANPPPDLAAWEAIADPRRRLRAALEELHGYYERTEGMLGMLFRDEHVVPHIGERFAVFHRYLAAARHALLVGRDVSGSAGRRLHAAVGHAVAFSTWRSLVREQGAPPADAVGLLSALVESAS